MTHASKEEEIKRLLELKQIPDNLRSHKQQMEMDKLNKMHQFYAPLNATEMKNTLKHRPSSFVLLMNSPGNGSSMSLDYENKFSNRAGFSKPASKNGLLTLTFKSEQDAVDFLTSQAAKGRKFRVLDGQRRPIAFSNGKGVIQLANGQPFNSATAQKTLVNAVQNKSAQAPGQNTSPRPLMTVPQSTVSIKPLKKPPSSSVPKKQTPLQETPEIKHSAHRLTPFKRTPFDQ